MPRPFACCWAVAQLAAFGYASVGVSESSRLIVKSTFGERLRPEAGVGYSIRRATPSDAGTIAALSAMDSAGRAGTLVRTEENIAARLRAEPWAKAGGGWGVWGACPWLVSRTRDNTAVGFLVLREDATGSHSQLKLGPLADSAPSWKADNIGRGVAPGTPSFCLERGPYYMKCMLRENGGGAACQWTTV